MCKNLLLFITVCIYTNSFSQQKLVEFNNDLDNSKLSIKEVIPAVNQKTNDLSLFFMNSKQVFGYLLNDSFEVVKKLSSEDRRRKYKTIIGYSVKGDSNYNLYLTNKKKNKFAAINFSFDNEKATLSEFKIGESNEKFIQTATIDNTFYLISITSGTSVLKIHALSDINLTTPIKLDLRKETFVDRRNERTSLYNLFTVKSTGKIKSINVQKIDSDSPNSIDITSEEAKFYVKDNKFVFTFNNNRDIIQTLEINPIDYSYALKTIDKPLKHLKSGVKKSNSFILDSKLFTIASTKANMQVIVQDYNSGSILKEISLNVNDSITFKNTPIIQEGGVYASYRELESTKKFLRKLTSGDIGISVYKQNNDYRITIGSEKEIPRGGGGMMMPMGGFGGFPIATFGSANVFFNPTYFAYNAYSSTKSVHIKSLFDADFNHVKGDLPDNIFDKIKNQSERGNLIAAKTIFKYKDYFILGNYIPKSKTYILRKFTD